MIVVDGLLYNSTCGSGIVTAHQDSHFHMIRP
jgi:hypothetical protein